MNRERWQEMAQIRRWDVKFTNISLENLFKETYCPFLEFIIGGNLKIIESHHFPRKMGLHTKVF